MLSLTPSDPAPTRFPWEEGHACPEDRALGLELQLIELVHERDALAAAAPPERLERLDEQIDATMNDLAAAAAAAATTWPGSVPAA